MTLEYKGINIFYTDKGQGSTIVLLHGFLENSSMWSPFISKLTKKNRVISIDLLGHGHTECLGYIHTMEAMAECVKFVLNHLNIENAIFVGHSMGGYVALAYTELFQKDITALVLMNSTAMNDSKQRIEIRNKAIDAVKVNYEKVVKMSIDNLFRPKNRSIFKDEIIKIKTEALKTPLQSYIAAQEGMKIRKDRTHILNLREFKKMIFISKKDPVLDYDVLIQRSENLFENVVVFPDGHMPHIENKEVFLQELMRFIENL